LHGHDLAAGYRIRPRPRQSTAERGRDRLVQGHGRRALRACVAPALAPDKPRGTAIVCPGRTEFIEKYFEVGHELQAMGFAVVILDWPGQGLSERLLDDTKKGHIDRFETFMGALANGLEALDDRLPRPYVSLAHSMGGAIALAAIAQGLVKVDAAAFSRRCGGSSRNSSACAISSGRCGRRAGPAIMRPARPAGDVRDEYRHP
jgi:pimeloyl-ACP methyl ester carboxylesterase